MQIADCRLQIAKCRLRIADCIKDCRFLDSWQCLAQGLQQSDGYESQSKALKNRTKRFALDVLAFNRTLPFGDEVRDIARQLARSATGVAANYRSGCRARSKSEFASRVAIALDEADESALWLEIIVEDGMSHSPKALSLLDEANQLAAIFTASCLTANTSLGRR